MTTKCPVSFESCCAVWPSTLSLLTMMWSHHTHPASQHCWRERDFLGGCLCRDSDLSGQSCVPPCLGNEWWNRESLASAPTTCVCWAPLMPFGMSGDSILQAPLCPTLHTLAKWIQLGFGPLGLFLSRGNSQKVSKSAPYWGYGARELSYTVSGNVNLCSHYGKQYRGPLKKTRVTIWSSNPTPGQISGETSNLKRHMLSSMFTAALFTIAKTWKQPKTYIDRWMDKDVACIHTHRYT